MINLKSVLILVSFAVAVFASSQIERKYDMLSNFVLTKKNRTTAKTIYLIKEPTFTDAKLDSGDYVANYGSHVTCQFMHEPFHFKQNQLIINPVANHFNMNEFVLRFKKIDNEVIESKPLHREIEEITYDRTYGVQKYIKAWASIDIETARLDKNAVYMCCLEYADKESSADSGLCSHLKFCPKIASPEKKNTAGFFNTLESKQQLFKMSQVLGQVPNKGASGWRELAAVKLARDVMLTLTIVCTFSILIGVLAWKLLEMKRMALIHKHQQLIGGAGNTNGDCFTIRMPSVAVNTPSLYDELYVKYNLNAHELDTCEFPPAYEQIGSNQRDSPRVQKF
jgi:hypothetical protein